ncbi:MerR family transcriptional regulator [Brevibacillus laterosporus]|uniref:MerR family DNA-binding transcriptional regulator n=1 Tax=Brevibacillus laterosporus TaxID=1465 RepID=UPI002E22C0CA|nr:MerR family DNA-binding transcriptional regulator [Brevibacillus laterosporus]MED1790478.1 MerR family transcriptional regulator [Brevibacillus laterosporus]
MYAYESYVSIGDFSRKTRTTVMTLHYYDEIDILKPTFVSESGRRYYSDQDLNNYGDSF